LSQGRSRSNSTVWTLVCLALITGAGLGLYAAYTQTAVDGWDPLAYLYAGQRIAEGKGPTLCHPYNQAIGPYFTLAGFNVRVNDGPCLHLNYPPGFPILLAAAQMLIGSPDAALYVPALLGALGIAVTFALGAVMFDRWVGLVGAVIAAMAPTFIAASTSPWSDLAGTVFVAGGTALYLWGRSLPATQTRRSALVCGIAALALVYAVSIRYVNVVALLPLALYVLASQRRDTSRRTSDWLFAGIVGLGLVGILAFNRVYYGGFLTTGYSPRHGWYTWPPFSLRYALGPSPAGGQSLEAVLRTLEENLTWLSIPGVVGFIVMPRDKALLIGGVAFIFILVYALYAFPAQGINARLILPVFPVLALAAAYGIRYGASRWGWNDPKGRLWSLIGGALLVVSLGFPLPSRLRALNERNVAAARTIQTVQALVENSEPDAVFLAYGLNDPLLFYGERLSLFYRRISPRDAVTGSLRWDQFEDRLVAVVSELLRLGVPVYYVEDNDPPFADSLNILARHFVLESKNTVPATFRVSVEP
jgi:hypothetical protein